jgi:hypothetical protein
MANGDSAPEGFWGHYVRGLGLSTRNNSLAYGYSVAVTGSFGMINRLTGRPSVADIFLFVVGASAPFTLLNPLVTRGFRRRVEREPPLVVAVGTSFSVVSSCAGIGLAALLAWQVGGWITWLCGSLAAAVVYLLASALEIAAARGLHTVAGTEDLERR